MKYAWVSCKLFVSSFPDDVFLVLFGFLLLTFVVSPHPTPSGFDCVPPCRKVSRAESVNYRVPAANHHQGCPDFEPAFTLASWCRIPATHQWCEPKFQVPLQQRLHVSNYETFSSSHNPWADTSFLISYVASWTEASSLEETFQAQALGRSQGRHANSWLYVALGMCLIPPGES